MAARYADIIIEISHEALDRIFQYIIPEALASQLNIGMQVLIPFGKGNRIIKGYVLGFSDRPQVDHSLMKEIIDIAVHEIQLEAQFIQLAWWIKQQYGSTMIQALKTVLPIQKSVKPLENKVIILNCSKALGHQRLEEFKRKKNMARVRLLEALIQSDYIPMSEATNKLNISAQTIKGLEKLGIIQIEANRGYRNPMTLGEHGSQYHSLNEEQQYVVNQVLDAYVQKDMRPHLIHGVTGSGKTEVYIELISYYLKQDKQAIVLIPEIALTYQTVRRFNDRFGSQVSYLHSKLSKGERHDQFVRAQNGEISVMIGPRSALFTPFRNLGIIIMDEEHEMSYKSETMPKYHAREVAVERARLADAIVVMGSATPSIEAYYKAQNNEYRLHELRSRFNRQLLPTVSVVDLREELKSGNRSIFSNQLRYLMEDRLRKKEQSIIFINRRGYASFVSCRSCGYVMKCKHCDVSYTYHSNGKLVCHYCGSEETMPRTCPSCSSPYIKEFGTGTQKVEALIQKEFPTAKVLRMDMDTTSQKNSYERILAQFSDGEADILVGTQMIAKGHDFKKVTLVGVLAADLSLFSNDYRSSERTFQLLTQVAGRAGRGKLAGEVVIQTYNPTHYSVQRAKEQDYKAFFEEEILYRRLLNYPPVANMLLIFLASSDELLVQELSLWTAKYIKHLNQGDNIELIGPAPAKFSKINDIYRQVIYLKHPSYDHLMKIKDYLEVAVEGQIRFKKVQIQFDFNPLSIY